MIFGAGMTAGGLAAKSATPAAAPTQAEKTSPPKAAAEKPTATAPRVATPLLGKWEVTDAAPAPWTAEKERAALADQARRMLKTQIVFSAREVVTANKSIACKRADYELTEYSPDALFRGALPEPNQDSVARTLGLPRGDVPGVDVDCYSETVSYHFRDKNTALFALDDVIYTLSRR